MHWQIGKGGGFHYAAAEARGADLPVTVFLGGPPALILAAIAPLPENVPELLLASLIAGARLPLVTGRGPHPLVADAEFALVGQVPPARAPAGGAVRRPLRLLLAAARLPGVRGRARSRIGATRSIPRPSSASRGRRTSSSATSCRTLLSPLFPLVMPAVRRLWTYGETGYHSLAAAVVRERYRREAMASAFRILGEGQLSLTKFLLVTDRDVDLARLQGHARRTCSRGRGRRRTCSCSRTCRWTRSTTPGRGERGLQGRLARARRSGADAAGGVLVGRRPGRRARRACILAIRAGGGRPLRSAYCS